VSVAGRGAKRQPLDFYETPSAFCDAIVRVIPVRSPDAMVLDAGAGSGAWGAALKQVYPDVWLEGIDIDERPVPSSGAYDEWHPNQDFLASTQESLGTYDVILGNPPFSLAEEFVRHAHTLLAPGGVVAFLLRLNFLEGKQRGEKLWKELPLSVLHVFSSRPSFTGDGRTDASEYALFVWAKGHHGKFTGGWL